MFALMDVCKNCRDKTDFLISNHEVAWPVMWLYISSRTGSQILVLHAGAVLAWHDCDAAAKLAHSGNDWDHLFVDFTY